MFLRQSLMFATSVLGCTLVLMLAAADYAIAQQIKPMEGSPLALVSRGEAFWYGGIDKDGNFIRNPDVPPNSIGFSPNGIPSAVQCFVGNGLVYEHRSGRFIKGTMVVRGKPGHSSYYLVPELGSIVLDIKEVDLKRPDRFIWNMPDTIPAYVAERIRKYGDKPAPMAPDPPKAGRPAGWEFTPFSQLKADPFGRNVDHVRPIKHARIIGDVTEFGQLSDEGDFIPDLDLPVVSRSGIHGQIRFDLYSNPRYYTVPVTRLPRGQKREGQKEDDSEPVFEYRSGRLIKGELQKTGNFVPELGSKIMDFKDYDPITDRRRIYNLPGVLKKIEKK